ncbi:MAG: polysaccharide pyruvyl transferase family protein [Aristaeellaceae bacterium]
MAAKRILLHGAINTSNFGDVLFTTIFCRYIKAYGGDRWEPCFLESGRYGIGEFVRRENGYDTHLTPAEEKASDALLYISGGYFGDNRKSFRLSIRRWMRYVRIGLHMCAKQRDILILGVGGGPLYAGFNRRAFRKIMDSACCVTVRDPKTKAYFEDLGVKRPIEITADTALTITQEQLPALDAAVSAALDEYLDGRKMLFVHLVGADWIDVPFAKQVVPAINRFVEANRDYRIVIGFDGVYDHDVSQLETVRALEGPSPFYYRYSSAWQLCAFLNRAELVVTTKLHVGIVSSSLGKSVISFPEHAYKTERFYEQIGEQGRSVRLKQVTDGQAYTMLEQYAGVPIHIPDEIRTLALRNLDCLREYLETH